MSLGSRKVKVLIVDDSALIRSVLTEIIDADERLEVVGSAVNPYDAREKIKALNPDVLTLDIEMPKMNGITFLKNLMRLRPMPVVMISTLTQEGAPKTLEALECGAVDFLPKPKNQGPSALGEYGEMITEKVFAAASANVTAIDSLSQKREVTKTQNKSASLSIVAQTQKARPGFICAIGASTGGTEAIKEVVAALPENMPPVVVAQHIPAAFSASFAQRVDRLSAMNVVEASHNQAIEPGTVYIAPGHSHLKVKCTGSGYRCILDDGELVNRHKPSVEVLYDSVIEAAGSKAVGVLLTGMGADGAEALLRMKEAGCITAAQDEASSIVWGMPGAAVKLGAVEKVLGLDKLARYIVTQAFK